MRSFGRGVSKKKCGKHVGLTDWLTDGLTDGLADWLTDGLTDGQSENLKSLSASPVGD